MAIEVSVPNIQSLDSAYPAIVAGEFVERSRREGYYDTYTRLAEATPATMQMTIRQMFIGNVMDDSDRDRMNSSILTRNIIEYGTMLGGYFFQQTRNKCIELTLEIQRILNTPVAPVLGMFAMLTTFHFDASAASANPDRVSISAFDAVGTTPNGAIVRIGFLDNSYSWVSSKLPYDIYRDDPNNPGQRILQTAGVEESDLIDPANWRQN